MIKEPKKEKQHKVPKAKKRKVRKKGALYIGIGTDRDYLLENLSMLVSSGMNMLTALDSISREMRTRIMKKIMREMIEDIGEGYSLSKAFDRSGIFKEHTISLVRIGEESGRLSENLKLIAEQEEKDRSFRSKLRSAMMYPLFVLGLTVIIGIAISWFILPRLASVFDQINVKLPLITKWLIAFGEFLGEYGMYAVPSFIFGLVLFLYLLFGFSKTKFVGQTIMFWTPGIRNLLREVELARFTYLLGTLLEAGVNVTQALDSIHKSTAFRQYAKLYAYMRDSIEEGQSFQKSFGEYRRSNRLIPIPVQSLIAAAEQSGQLSYALKRISHSYEERTENTTKNLSVILEPVLLVIVWLGVVMVALAVILPIYSLIGGLNTSPEQRIQERNKGNVPTKSVENEIVISEEFTEEEEESYVKILPTGAGYLNVRDDDLIDGEIIGKVIPGETYEYIDERDGWYEIVMEGDEFGWVFGEYVELLRQQE